MKRALLTIGGACNNRCHGCPTAQHRARRASRDQVRKALERLATAGFEAVTLGGGEPTLRRALPGWIATASRLELETTLRTNGRLLASRGMAAALAARGLTAFEVKLPAGDPTAHQALTRADGFHQTLDGLAAAARVAPVRVRCAMGTRSLGDPSSLVAVVDAVANRAPHATIIFALGGDVGAGGTAPPPWEEAGRVVDAALTRARERGLRASHEGLPLCLLPGHEEAAVAPEADGVVAALWADSGALRWLGRSTAPTPLACHECVLEPRCPGAPPGWQRHLRALPGLRSNSFHYAPTGAPLPWPAGGECPALELDTATLDPTRGFFLCRDNTLQWHATTSRDFSRRALWRTRARRGQVYLDVSDKAAADDFARDLAPLTPVEACAACPRRPQHGAPHPQAASCPGAYRPQPDRAEGTDVFTRDDQVVRQILTTLTGDVLDVGCGEGPYLEALGPRAQAGQVRYWGVDPEAARVQGLRAQWPGLRLTVGAAEDLSLPPASLDAALVLRSYNHLRDPASVLANLARALRPGGTLLIVDNVAFGLVRTPSQVARAEDGPAVFEHYRDATAAQAKARVDAAVPAGWLRLAEERPVGPGTSNQWLLRYVQAETGSGAPPAAAGSAGSAGTG